MKRFLAPPFLASLGIGRLATELDKEYRCAVPVGLATGKRLFFLYPVKAKPAVPF